MSLEDAETFLVDDYYRTSAEGAYAVGDVTPGPQFTHASWTDHRLLYDVLTARARRSRSQRLVPITAFTDPQVARVDHLGLSPPGQEEPALTPGVVRVPVDDEGREILAG